MPAFTSQPQSITTLWLLLVSRPAEGRRLSWQEEHLYLSCPALSGHAAGPDRESNPRPLGRQSDDKHYLRRIMDLVPSVFWRCWLGGRKGIRPVKTEWWSTSRYKIAVWCSARDVKVLLLSTESPTLSGTGNASTRWSQTWSQTATLYLLYWRGYLSGATCKWFAMSIWWHCHPIISCSSKTQNGLPFCWRLTQVVLKKGR